MKKLLFLFIFINSCLLCFSQSFNFLDLVTNIRNAIDVKNTIDIKDPKGWLPPSDQKIWPDRVVTSFYKKEISEYVINGYNRDKNDGSWDSLILTITPINMSNLRTIPYSMVSDLYDSLRKIFGEPTRLVDYGFLRQPTINQNCKAQWDIGDYIVTFQANDVDYIIGNPAIMNSYIRIAKRLDVEILTPLIGIRFIPIGAKFIKEGFRRDFTETELLDMSISLVLDYNNKDILRMDMKYWGKMESVTAGQVIFLIKNAKGNPGIRATLNRYDGDMSYIVYDTKTGDEVIAAKGKVEKIDIGKSMF